MDIAAIRTLLGDDADALLAPRGAAARPPGKMLPGPDWVVRAWGASDRSPVCLRNLQAVFDAGRLGGTGYLSLLAASGGDPGDLATLAIEGGCSALVATEPMLASVARTFAHRIPLIVELVARGQPPADVARRIRDLGAVGVYTAATADPRPCGGLPALVAAAQAEGLFAIAPTAQWCVGPQRTETNLAEATTIGAALGWWDGVGRDPIAVLRADVAGCWNGRVGVLVQRSGELAEQVHAAVVARRAGGVGTVIGAGVSFLPREQGVALLHAVQDVLRCAEIPIAS